MLSALPGTTSADRRLLVTLSEKHRSALYAYLVPEVGEEVAEAFIAEFPAGDGEEPITRDFMRAELAELRTELLVRMATIIVGWTTLLATVVTAAVILSR
jgi:hypothetical protein